MIQRPVAFAVAGRAANRGLNIGAGAGHGVFQSHALREAGGDGGGECAARPVGMTRLDARALEYAHWGRFDVRIDARHRLLAAVARMMNLRSRLSGIATGDQAMFVRRSAFEAAGGFPQIPLMEDIALSARLKRAGRPACLRERVVTSGRRWERQGVLSTVFLMWRLRFAYWLGADPVDLARRYRPPA